MIPVFPIDCGKEPCDDPLVVTGEMSKNVLYVLNYLFDDLETIQKTLTETNQFVISAPTKYVNYLLTKITNNVNTVIDTVNMTLENILTEQQVLLNTVAPGLFDAAMAELDKPQPESPPAKESVAVPTKPQVNGEGKDVSPAQLAVLPMPSMPGISGSTGQEPTGETGSTPGTFTSNQPETQFQPGSTAATILPIDVSLALNTSPLGNSSGMGVDGKPLGQQNQATDGVIRVCLVQCPDTSGLLASILNATYPEITAVNPTFPGCEGDDEVEDWQ